MQGLQQIYIVVVYLKHTQRAKTIKYIHGHSNTIHINDELVSTVDGNKYYNPDPF